MSSVTNSQQLFTTQYTAVLLIILTFVVGAFARPKPGVTLELPRGAGSIEKPIVETPSRPEKEIGKLKIADAFSSETNALRTEQFSGVVLALKSHDIGVKLIIREQLAGEGEAQARLLSRIVSTYRWLESLGIPSGTYQVEGAVVPEITNTEVEIEFLGGFLQ